MPSAIVIAAACGIITSSDKIEFGGHINLNRNWTHSLFK